MTPAAVSSAAARQIPFAAVLGAAHGRCRVPRRNECGTQQLPVLVRIFSPTQSG